MREQTQRMEGLVKQLLTLSRIEAAPALAMNDRIDVPMMLRVVEREAVSYTHLDVYKRQGGFCPFFR